MNEDQLLDKVNSPADLKALSQSELIILANQIREFIIEQVSKSGGHLASNLGTIELSIALHYVFNSPTDKIIWDVGHQSYTHKIITGRKEQIGSIRQLGSISGFPTRSESEHDAFGTAHASTSISAALGHAIGAKLQGNKEKSIAIIGDSALTGGMAFEAMNHAGSTPDLDMLVIINDNQMSISHAVGALRDYLGRIPASASYEKVLEGIKKRLHVFPRDIQHLAHRVYEHTKGMVLPGTLFEELGFNYSGPLDGHNLAGLIQVLSRLKRRKGMQILHLLTVKGKGYNAAEQNPIAYHGISAPAKIETPRPNKQETFSQVFGNWCEQTAQKRNDFIVITPAMIEGSGLVAFHRKFPERCLDVGIAEQHALTLAAALACQNVFVVVAIYSTFLQRAYDQLIHDICLQNLKVTLAIDRGGLVGADGATHQGTFDLSYLRPIPNLQIFIPANKQELQLMLSQSNELPGAVAIRYPRAPASEDSLLETTTTSAHDVFKALTVHQGKQTALLCFGPIIYSLLAFAKQKNLTLINMRALKPLDESLLHDLSKTHTRFITIEENMRAGGAGSAITEWLSLQGYWHISTHLIALADQFIDHASREEQLAIGGLDAEQLCKKINNIIEQEGTK